MKDKLINCHPAIQVQDKIRPKNQVQITQILNNGKKNHGLIFDANCNLLFDSCNTNIVGSPIEIAHRNKLKHGVVNRHNSRMPVAQMVLYLGEDEKYQDNSDVNKILSLIRHYFINVKKNKSFSNEEISEILESLALDSATYMFKDFRKFCSVLYESMTTRTGLEQRLEVFKEYIVEGKLQHTFYEDDEEIKNILYQEYNVEEKEEKKEKNDGCCVSPFDSSILEALYPKTSDSANSKKEGVDMRKLEISTGEYYVKINKKRISNKCIVSDYKPKVDPYKVTKQKITKNEETLLSVGFLNFKIIEGYEEKKVEGNCHGYALKNDSSKYIDFSLCTLNKYMDYLLKDGELKTDFNKYVLLVCLKITEEGQLLEDARVGHSALYDKNLNICINSIVNGPLFRCDIIDLLANYNFLYSIKVNEKRLLYKKIEFHEIYKSLIDDWVDAEEFNS